MITGVYVLDEKATQAQKHYWHYQNNVKSMESSLGAVIGVPGAMFAIRSQYTDLLDESAINDDFILSMNALKNGGKAIVDKNINIVERECDEQSHDYARRVRLGAGNWQQIKVLLTLFNPKLGWVSFNFISHKVLRGIMPLLLALIYVLLFSMALFSNVMLAKLGCGAIALFHGIELTKRVFNITATIPVVDKVNYILNAYFLALWGIIKYEKGDYKATGSGCIQAIANKMVPLSVLNAVLI